VRDYLKAHGHPRVERLALGGTRDKGDLTGIPGWLPECKSLTRLDLGEALATTERKAARFGLEPVVIFRRHRHPVGRAYVVMPLETWARVAARDNQVASSTA
jgi:hypothetical protein